MTGAAPARRSEERPETSAADFDELYRIEAPRLLRMFGRRLGPTEAADLVQESFLRLVRRGQDDPPIASPAGYLRMIARNLVRNPHAVRARRQQAQLTAFDDELFCGHDPVAGLETRDMLGRLDAGVAKLKPRTREIFLAHRVEGLTYAQIAERTGLSLKGVEKQMSKALATLDRLIHR